MSTNFIDEYLVKLGASVDANGMQRFNQALREATAVSNASATSIAGAFFKTQLELTAGFAAIGGAVIGLVDKVAMADQSYRLFALHMYMSQDAARGLKVAMDALGEPLENLTWDPELRARTRQLLADQQAMAPSGDFETQMRKVRDIRFEFTRMEVEGQYLAMHVVQDFMKALGVGPDEVLVKLKNFNDWVVNNIPSISTTLVNTFMPVWHDIEDIAKETGAALYQAAGAFQMLVGVISGDDSIDAGTVSFESMATSLGHVAHGLALVIKQMLWVDAHTTGTVKAFYHSLRGTTDSLLGDQDAAAYWGGRSDQDTAVATDFEDPFSLGDGNDVHSLVTKYATEQGVDPALAHAVAKHESGEQQFDANGKPKRNPKSTATGVFQLLNGTASTLGVDSTDTKKNIEGGVKYLRQLLAHYQGDLPKAIGGFQVGQGTIDSVLAGKATLSDEAKGNIGDVLQRMGQHGDVHVGSIVIHIDKPGATNADVGNAVADRIRSMQNKQTQRNLSEFQDHAWSY